MSRLGWRVALAIGCVLVSLLALQVESAGLLTRLDASAVAWLALHRNAGLTRAMLLVSAAHQTAPLLGAAGLLAAWLAIRHDWMLARRLLLLPAAMLLNAGLKIVFQRPRPHLDEPLVQLATLSFPSGHAVASTVFYGLLCTLVFAHWRSRGVRIVAAILAAAMVLMVTFSRVYLGAHYPTDVLAGVMVGALCLLLLPLRRRTSA